MQRYIYLFVYDIKGLLVSFSFSFFYFFQIEDFDAIDLDKAFRSLSDMVIV